MFLYWKCINYLPLNDKQQFWYDILHVVYKQCHDKISYIFYYAQKVMCIAGQIMDIIVYSLSC
jgi:hypothetical protein